VLGHLIVVFICATSIGSAVAAPMKRKHWSEDVGPHAQCMTRVRVQDQDETERRLIYRRQVDSDLVKRELVASEDPSPVVVFNVSFNVVYANETQAAGYIDDARLEKQMEVLNEDYKAAKISFVLVQTTRIHNADWFNGSYPGSEYEQAMKKMHRIGDAKTLNVYTVTFNSTTHSLGTSSLPSDYERDPDSDGVLIRHSTISGGSREHFNLGRTLTHEVGHWLGLAHTFEGGCDDGVGDGVADTPPQASGSEGCPTGRDSCEGDGPDLINNFMDYSYDACMSGFTEGQIARMHETISVFRSSRDPTASLS